MRLFPLLPLMLLIAAAPVPAPMRDRLIADAAALPPERLAFDRTTRSVRTGGGSTTRINIVERWDGARWKLVSVAGAKPSTADRRDHERLAKSTPVPGYHRLTGLLAAATTTSADEQNRIWWHIPMLPRESVRTDSSDISNHLQADMRLARRGDGYFVDQLRISAREPFKMNLLIKVSSFEQIIDYAPGSDGKPRLMSQKSESKGTMFGFPGGETTLVTFVYR